MPFKTFCNHIDCFNHFNGYLAEANLQSQSRYICVTWPDFLLTQQNFCITRKKFWSNSKFRQVTWQAWRKNVEKTTLFIAHFWQICPSLCTAPFLIQIPIEMRAAAKHALPIMPLLPLFSFLSFWENKMEEQRRCSNPRIRGI